MRYLPCLLILCSGIMLSPQTTIAADKTSGKATVYSNSFNGKKTADGSTFKQKVPSVASNKLPLGSTVLVKNKKTGKTVVAKVNDRMAKKSTAAVDLSKAAADKLGVKGTAQVDAKVVSKGTAKPKQ